MSGYWFESTLDLYTLAKEFDLKPLSLFQPHLSQLGGSTSTQVRRYSCMTRFITEPMQLCGVSNEYVLRED